MTAPFRPTRQQLHAVSQMAMADLERDPNNGEAREALMQALDGIRSWSQNEGPQQAQAGARRDTEQATNPGVVRSAVQGFAQGASFGLSDELAGAAEWATRLVPGGESPGQAYVRGRDQNRAEVEAARAFNPTVTGVADLAGGVATGGTAVRGLVRAAPVVGRTLQAGATAGASIGQKLRAALTGGAIGAPLTSLDAYGRGEEGATEDLGRVPMGAALGGTLGTLGTYAGGALARRSQVRAAQELKAVNEGQASALDLQRSQAQVAADEARARLLGARADEAAQVGPARVQSAQNQAALSTERLQAQPTIRARQAAAADRAAGSAERAGAREVDRATDLPVRREMDEYRRQLLAFRASRIGRMAGAPGSRVTPEDGLRQWGRQQGLADDAIERLIVANQRSRMPGGAVPDSPTPTSQPVEPVVPVSGTDVPASVTPPPTMPGSPREAARSAHALVEAAGGDANEAARRAAGMAQNAVPENVTQGLDDIASTLGDNFQNVQRILSRAPDETAQAELLAIVESLDEVQRQTILRNMPRAWRQALGGN